MPTTYTTRDGDMVDEICYRHYGTVKDTVEAVLEANYGLEVFLPVLQAGHKILLPDIVARAFEKAPIRLWD